MTGRKLGEFWLVFVLGALAFTAVLSGARVANADEFVVREGGDPRMERAEHIEELETRMSVLRLNYGLDVLTFNVPGALLTLSNSYRTNEELKSLKAHPDGYRLRARIGSLLPAPPTQVPASVGPGLVTVNIEDLPDAPESKDVQARMPSTSTCSQQAAEVRDGMLKVSKASSELTRKADAMMAGLKRSDSPEHVESVVAEVDGLHGQVRFLAGQVKEAGDEYRRILQNCAALTQRRQPVIQLKEVEIWNSESGERPTADSAKYKTTPTS